MRAWLYGWAEGRRIKPKDYLGEAQEAREFLERHAKLKHAAVVAALAFFEKWLKNGAEGVSVPAREEMHRLYCAGVTPMDALVECAAVWLLSRRRPALLPDGLPLTYALGAALLYLRPRIYHEVYRNGEREMRPEKFTGSKRRLVGRTIRDALGVFFFNLERAAEREHTERVNQSLAVRTPFTNTNP